MYIEQPLQNIVVACLWCIFLLLIEGVNSMSKENSDVKLDRDENEKIDESHQLVDDSADVPNVKVISPLQKAIDDVLAVANSFNRKG